MNYSGHELIFIRWNGAHIKEYRKLVQQYAKPKEIHPDDRKVVWPEEDLWKI